MGVYQIYYYAFERRGEKSIQGLAFFFGLLFVGEVALILIFGVDYRFVEARYIGPSLHLGFVDLPLRMLIPFVVSLLMLAVLQLFLGRTFIGRAILAVSQDRLALQLMAADPSRIKRFAFGLSIATASVAGALLIIIQPVEPSIGRDYIGRIFAICVLGGMTSFPGMLAGAVPDRRRRKPHRHLLRPLLGAGRGLRLSAADPGDPPRRHPRAVTMTHRPVLDRLVPCRRRHSPGVARVLHQRVLLLRRLSGSSVHRAGDGVEHPGWLYRLHQFRRRRLFRGRRLHRRRAAQADLSPRSAHDAGGRPRLGPDRLSAWAI